MEFKIIIKKLNNTLTEQEAVVFQNWYNESAEHREYFERVKKNHNANTDISVDVAEGWKVLTRRMDSNTKDRRYWKYAAAAVLILLISSIFFFDSDTITDISDKVTTISDAPTIEAGTDKAVLTLEDGSKVILDEESKYATENTKSNGKELVYKNKDETEKSIAYNYLTIPRGGQFFVQLSDGSKVWLNSESKLKYPVSFISGAPRRVELIYGEAYFDVSPSSKHKGASFQVHTINQDVEVLGTEFNISAYENDQSIHTTLIEGSVSVSSGVASRILDPGMQSVLHIADDEIQVETVDVNYVTAWKNGMFMFDKKPLGEMMKVLTRWYDIDVVFENPQKRNLEFSGALKRGNDINELLEKIERTGLVEFSIKNKEIWIK